MSSTRSPIRDVGPEFARRVDHQIQHDARRIAKRFSEIACGAPDCRTAGERAQAESDRLLSLSDEEAGHAFLP